MISWPYLAAFALLCLATVWFCTRLLRRGGSSSAWQEAQREPSYGPYELGYEPLLSEPPPVPVRVIRVGLAEYRKDPVAVTRLVDRHTRVEVYDEDGRPYASLSVG